MKHADIIIYGTLLTVAVLVILIAWWGIRGARKLETIGRHLTVDKLRSVIGSDLQNGPFMWGIWQKLLSAKNFHLLLHDAEGVLLTKIVFSHLPMDGVLQDFTLNGRRYECVNEGLLTGRSLLRDAQSGEIVLSCQHGMRYNTFYRAKSDDVLFRIKHGSVFKGYSVIIRGDDSEIGRLFSVHHPDCYARVLSLCAPALSLVEQCFIFVILPGRA